MMSAGTLKGQKYGKSISKNSKDVIEQLPFKNVTDYIRITQYNHINYWEIV